MAKTWIKLYTEIISDPKMGRMSDKLFRRTIELFLIAGKEDNDGILPPVEDIAWMLHATGKEIQTSIDDLKKLGVVSETKSGEFVVTNFTARQDSDLTKSEINKRYYEKSKKAKSEIQTDKNLNSDLNTSENSDEIQTEFSKNQTLDIEEEVEEEVEVEEELKERDREKETRALKTASKHKFGQFGHVLLTDAEYGKLCKRFGPSTDSKIQNLDDYLQNNRKKHYDDHYLTLLKWAEKDDKTAPQPARQEPAKRESWVELAERMQSQKNAVIAEADAITGFGGAA